MITIRATRLIAVDIDETLVIWNGDNYSLNGECLIKIMQFHSRGHSLIAWSAGGAEWAEAVVKQFNLEKYFVACMGKFDWFIDDKPADQFMGENIRVLPS